MAPSQPSPLYGILCATPEELAALAERLTLEPMPQLHGSTRVWRGGLGRARLVLAQCGIGKVNAAAATTVLLALYGAEALIFSGVAGGLDPELPVGSVLLADRLAIHDYGVVAQGAFTATRSGLMPIDAEPLTELAAVPAAVARDFDRLIARVGPTLGHPIRRGGVLTGDHFLNCRETRVALRARYGADAIDMESGAVHQVAEAWGAPLYVIRTLSDLAGEESHLAYFEMAGMAAANAALCVTELIAMLEDTPPAR